MKGAIHKWIGTLLAAAIVVQAQGGPQNCPGTTSLPSMNTKSRTWACMHTWDPCKLANEENSYWLTWPLTKVTEVGKLKSPVVTGGAIVTPGHAAAYQANMCQTFWEGGVEKQRLKPEWKLYHRSIFNYDKVSNAGSAVFGPDELIALDQEKPYFSVYNVVTGVLRTFVFVVHPQQENRIYSQSFFKEFNPTDPRNAIPFTSAFGVLENGLSAGLPLSLQGQSEFPGWTDSEPLTEYGYFWYVTEKNIPYNIWDMQKQTSHTQDRFMEQGFFGELESEINISGKMITETKSSTLPPGLAQGRFSGISGKLANVGLNYLTSGSDQSLSFDLDKDWTDWSCTTGDCSSFNGFKGAYGVFQKNLLDFAGLNSNDWVSQGINLGLGPVAGSLVTGFLGMGATTPPRVTWQESQIKLSGLITTRVPINTIRVPISKWNPEIRPYYARRDESEGDVEIPRDDSDMGLFTLLDQPTVHVRRVEHHLRGYRSHRPTMDDFRSELEEQIRYWGILHPMDVMKYGSLSAFVSAMVAEHEQELISAWNEGMRLVWQNGDAEIAELPNPDYSYIAGNKYYFTIDNPEGLIQVNPLTKTQLVSVKVAPMFWDNTNKKWVPMEEPQSMLSLANAASPQYWFSSIDQKLHHKEKWAVGVNMALQFIATNEDGSVRPILFQQVFPAKLDFELDRMVYMPIQAVFIFDDTRKLFPLNIPSQPQYVDPGDRMVFEVETQTGVDYLSGTDANISVRIKTCDGGDYVFPLATPHVNDFENGAYRIYAQTVDENLGPVVSVEFQNDNLGSHSGWQLARFSVSRRHLQSGHLVDKFSSKMTVPVWINDKNSKYEESVDPVTTCATWKADETAGESQPSLQTGLKVASAGGIFHIFGTGFGFKRDAVSVSLDQEPAEVLQVTPNTISVRVPALPVGRYALSVITGGLEAAAGDTEVEIRDRANQNTPTPVEQSFLNFDEQPTTWHSSEASLTSDATTKVGTTGFSLSVSGEGYRVLRSERFCATGLGKYGSTLAVDVFVPANPSNPWWLGEVALFVDAPSAGVYNSWQGNVQLTGLSTGAWHTVEIPLNVQALMALSGTGCDLEFGLVLNAASANEPYRFDNLHFTGEELVSAEAPIVNPPSTGTGADFVCGGPCLQAEMVGGLWVPMTLNTVNEKWYVLSQKPSGWQASEIAGRTLSVNGIALTAGSTFPSAASDGKWYLHFSAGEHTWASWSQW